MSTAVSSLARVWSGALATNAVMLLCGIGTGVLAARLLGPADRGLLAVVMFWPGLLIGIGFFSLSEAIVFRANKTLLERRRFISTAATLSLFLAVPALLCGALLVPWLLGANRSDAVILTVVYLLALVPMHFLGSALLAFDHAERRFTRYNLLRLFPQGFYLIGLLLLWSLGAVSVQNALWASLIGTALAVLVRFWSWRQELIGWPSLSEGLSLLRQALLFHGTTLIVMLSGQADRLVVFRLFSDTEVAHYVVAQTIAIAGLAMIADSVHTVLFPRLAAEPDRAIAQAQLRTGLRRATFLLLSGSAVAVLMIPIFLPFLFGAAFAQSVPVAILLVIAYVPLALRQIIVRCLRAFGDSRTGFLAEGTALATFLLLLPLPLTMGIVGVTLALLAANIAGLVVACPQLRRRHHIAVVEWLVPTRAMLADALALAAQICWIKCSFRS